jgi:hypothetical protein
MLSAGCNYGDHTMGPKLAYGDKLKDPRWQKKRLAILEKAHWQCSSCEAKDATLHVHHLQYVGDNPWETPDELLECLCENCHEAREGANRLAYDMFRELPTKQVHRFSQNVAIAVDLFKTAPEHLRAAGLPNFVMTLLNHGIEKFWKDSPRVSVTAMDYTIFSDKPQT